MQKGFTLIEVMIIVAIIGICAGIFIPAWQQYDAKKRAETTQQSTTEMVKPTEVPATPPPDQK